MNERRPMSGRFHHAGLLFIPLLPIGIALIDLTLLGHTWRPYLWAALWVVPWHLVQLRLDYRHSEIWYVRLTSPPYRVNFRQFLSLLWPALVALIPAPLIGVNPVCAFWLLCLALHYPLQRALYVRSQREFGCPNCGLLLSRSGIRETGVCPHCRPRLIDGAAPDDEPQRMGSVLHG